MVIALNRNSLIVSSCYLMKTIQSDAFIPFIQLDDTHICHIMHYLTRSLLMLISAILYRLLVKLKNKINETEIEIQWTNGVFQIRRIRSFLMFFWMFVAPPFCSIY